MNLCLLFEKQLSLLLLGKQLEISAMKGRFFRPPRVLYCLGVVRIMSVEVLRFITQHIQVNTEKKEVTRMKFGESF